MRRNNMALACIVFDCDGVILESVDAKTEAFRRVCGEIAPAHADAFIAYVTLHGGVSRYEKFAWLVRRAFDRDITPDETRAMGENFIRYCLEAVLGAPFVPGFTATVERWAGRVPLYVASGTPQHELEEVIRHKGLERFFAGVYGTPPAKAPLLQAAVRDANAPPKATVMVGDSKTDMDAALIVGTKFYGRGPYFSDKNVAWGDDLTGLNAYLDRVAAGEE